MELLPQHNGTDGKGRKKEREKSKTLFWKLTSVGA
jgi:hypothetical protein